MNNDQNNIYGVNNISNQGIPTFNNMNQTLTQGNSMPNSMPQPHDMIYVNNNSIIPEQTNPNTILNNNYNNQQPMMGVNPNHMMPNNGTNNNISPSSTTMNNNISQTNNQFGDPTPIGSTYLNSDSTNIVSVGKYLVHFLLLLIPIVNIVILFTRAFGKKQSKNISNLAKAQLILVIISIVISIGITIAIFPLIKPFIHDIIENMPKLNY